MTLRTDLKHALVAVAALASIVVAASAEAQKRRLPSRTDDIPDTESGRPAASATAPTFKGRMTIFGPPSLPVGMPPEHSKPAAVAEPAAPAAAASTIAAPAPPPVVASPAPAPVAAPATAPAVPAPPVIAPAPQVPAPVAVPIPAPAPPPAPAAPPVVLAPPVAPPKPAPVIATPTQRPEPVAKPEPARPAPVVAPVIAAPVIAAPAQKPAPVAPPRQEVAMAAPSSAAAAPAPTAIDTKLIEDIFACLSPGLPQDWKKTWIVISGAGGKPSAKFFFTTTPGDDLGEELVPCSAQALTQSITSLNDKLPADQRAWNRATLAIDSDGEYELRYDYPK